MSVPRYLGPFSFDKFVNALYLTLKFLRRSEFGHEASSCNTYIETSGPRPPRRPPARRQRPRHPARRRRRSASGGGRRRRSGSSRTDRSFGSRGLPQIAQVLRLAAARLCAWRCSASAPSLRRPASKRGGRIALARQQRRGLGERQADDAGIGADQPHARRRRRGPGSRSRPPCRAIRRWRDRRSSSSRESRLNRTRVSTSRWRRRAARRRPAPARCRRDARGPRAGAGNPRPRRESRIWAGCAGRRRPRCRRRAPARGRRPSRLSRHRRGDVGLFAREPLRQRARRFRCAAAFPRCRRE